MLKLGKNCSPTKTACGWERRTTTHNPKITKIADDAQPLSSGSQRCAASTAVTTMNSTTKLQGDLTYHPLHAPYAAHCSIFIFSDDLGCDFFAPIHQYTNTQKTVFLLCEGLFPLQPFFVNFLCYQKSDLSGPIHGYAYGYSVGYYEFIVCL